nr:ROK family protein [Salinispora arenicola]
MGTGIAAAHVIDGLAAAARTALPGRLGHVLVRPGGPRVRLRGATDAWRRSRPPRRSPAATRSWPAPPPERTGGERAEVATRAAAGDPLAQQVWTDAVEALADGLATGQALFDVEAVVLGGGLARAGAQLLDPLRAALHDRMTFHREPRLVPAALGAEAGCLGAALLALDDLEKP